jgi:hypothetical protein
VIEGHFIHKFPPSGKNQHCRGVARYAPNTARGKIQSFTVYNVMSSCIWVDVLKPITQNLISEAMHLHE